MMMRIVLVLAMLAPVRAAAESCPATAVLEGDAVLVDSIGALRLRGIATRATADCPLAKARIDRQGTAIAVSVVDPAGRKSQRVVVDTDVAASLIASWARQDVNASLLLGFVVPDAPAPAAESVARIDGPPSRASRSADPVTLALAGESSIDFAGTPWLGGRATACVRIGPVCAGAIARVLSADTRSGVDVLGAITLPLSLSRHSALVLGAGAGGGWFSARYSMGEVNMTSTQTGARLDGHASFAYLLGRRISLHVGVSIGGSPSAPHVIAEGDEPLTNNEPRGFVRADAGLRIGVP
jgi:hypothetical protein